MKIQRIIHDNEDRLLIDVAGLLFSVPCELGIPGGKPGMPYGFVRIFLFIFFYSSAAKVSG